MQKWRTSVRYRSAFRNAFLSFEPQVALRGQSHQHLLEIRTFLNELRRDFPKDTHLLSLVNGHRIVVDRLLRERAASIDSIEEQNSEQPNEEKKPTKQKEEKTEKEEI